VQALEKEWLGCFINSDNYCLKMNKGFPDEIEKIVIHKERPNRQN
jgi:hypothetical protein